MSVLAPANKEEIKKKLDEGNGEFVYRLGYDDSAGRSLSWTKSQFEEAIEGFRLTAKELGAKVHQITEEWILLRAEPSSMQDVVEVRVAVVGNVDAGKSTMLGVLTKGILDDGRGSARINLFRHKHEIDSGRTSSIGSEILGFGADASPIYSSTTTTGGQQKLSWEQVCAKAHKLIGFIDLAGHEKYLKTTMFGLTGCAPDYSMLMVGANAGMIGMAKEHLTLSFALGVPVLVVVTKIDMCPGGVLEETMKSLFKVLKSPACRRVPVVVKTIEEAIQCSTNLVAQRLCPIFQVSNVSGEGLDRLRTFLNVVPPPVQRFKTTGPVEFEIVETFTVPGVGTVVSGTMVSGKLSLGQAVWLGPDSLGNWTQTQIKGIHRKRVNVAEALAGQSVSLAIKKVKRSNVHKGMVIIAADPMAIPTSPAGIPPIFPGRKASWEFEAEIIVLFHSTTLGPRYQAMLHSGVIRQTVSIISMEREVMRTGDRAKVRFRFVKHPEYVRLGARLVFREGRTKGVGRITALF